MDCAEALLKVPKIRGVCVVDDGEVDEYRVFVEGPYDFAVAQEAIEATEDIPCERWRAMLDSDGKYDGVMVGRSLKFQFDDMANDAGGRWAWATSPKSST